ncbi:MAG: ATP-binding protein [Alphaproteobacteria bacterium]
MSEKLGFFSWVPGWVFTQRWAKPALWFLAILCFASGTAAYAISPRYLSLFLISNSIFLLLLIFLVIRRVLLLWLERKQGLAGSKLHAHVLGVFSLLVIAPTVIMALFSFFFVHLGMQAWFNEKVQTALQESQFIANAYLEEHQKVIIHSVRAIERDLEQVLDELLEDPELLNHYLTTQAHLRSLNEAILFSGSGKVLGRSRFSFSLEFEGILNKDLKAAEKDVVIYPNQQHDRVIALVQISQEKNVYLLVSHLVEKKVLDRISLTQEAVGAYQNLLDERSRVTLEFAFIFAMVTLLMLLLAIWGGFLFANRLVKPIGRLIEAARDIQKGDLSVRILTVSKVDELETLGDAFNQMVSELDSQTKALVAANHEVDRRRRFMESVLSGVSSGVLSLDNKGKIHLANMTSLHFFEEAEAELVGKSLQHIAPELWECLEEALLSELLVFEKQVGVERHGQFYSLRVSIRGASQQLGGFESIVMTFDDVTELLAAQRKAAWSDVARLIAHEIKNPLTPIQLAAERLKRRYLVQIEKDPATFQTCIDTIVRQVDYIGRMVGEFSSFARMPEPVMVENDLVALCQQNLFLQKEAFPKITFHFEPGIEALWMVCDAYQIGQVLTNLLKNAAESVQERLASSPLPPGEIWVELEVKEQHFHLILTDNGVGFPKEGRERLSEPYMTTKASGTGLGLAIVKKIVEDHGGGVFLRDRKEGPGAQVVLFFKKQIKDA